MKLFNKINISLFMSRMVRICLSELSILSLLNLHSLFLCLSFSNLKNSSISNIFSPIRVRRKRMRLVFQLNWISFLETKKSLFLKIYLNIPYTMDFSNFINDFFFSRWFSFLFEIIDKLFLDFTNVPLKIIYRLFLFSHREEPFFRRIECQFKEKLFRFNPIKG